MRLLDSDHHQLANIRIVIHFGPKKLETLAVVVHFGDTAPTTHVANASLAWATLVVVVVNDQKVRPIDLDNSIIWASPGKNLGYGGAANWAWTHFGAKFNVLALLNNDIELEVIAAKACIQMVSLDNIGVVAPVLIEGVDFSRRFGGGFTRILKRPVRHDEGVEHEVVDCEWVSGAIMFISTSLLAAVPFDTRYFLGFEDVDFCLRARNAGSRVVMLNDVSVVHTGGTTIQVSWYYYAVRNSIWFARSNFGKWRAWMQIVRLAFLLPRVLSADLVKQRGLRASTLMTMGLRDGTRYGRFNAAAHNQPISGPF